MGNGPRSIGTDPQPEVTQAASAEDAAQTATEVVRIDGYRVAIPKEEGAFNRIHTLFAERRPGVFQRLLQQLTGEGYNIHFGYIGFEQIDMGPWAVVPGLSDPIVGPALRELPNRLGAMVNKEDIIYRSVMFSRTSEPHDPLDMVRSSAKSALAVPARLNARKDIDVTPFSVKIEQDPTCGSGIVVKLTSWVEGGKVVWEGRYDTKKFVDSDGPHKSLNADFLAEAIYLDMTTFLKGYDLNKARAELDAARPVEEEFSFVGDKIVTVVSASACMCVAPAVFDEIFVQVQTTESGLTDAHKGPASSSQLESTTIFLNVPREPYAVRVDGQMGMVGWGDARGAKTATEEFSDEYHNNIVVKRDGNGEVAEVRALLAPQFSKDIYVNGAPLYAPVRLDMAALGAEGYSPCIEQRIIYPKMTSSDGDYALYSLTEDSVIDNIAPYFDKISGVLGDLQKMAGTAGTASIKGVVVASDVRANGFVHPQFPEYLFLTDYLINNFIKTADDRSKITDVARHEGIHVLDFQFTISGHPAITGFYRTVAGGLDDQFFDRMNEENFIVNGYGGHSMDDPKEFLATILNGILQDNWQERVALLPERIRHIYFYAIGVIAEAVKDKLPGGEATILYERLLECREFVRATLRYPELPLEDVTFSVEGYFRQGGQKVITANDANFDDVVPEGEALVIGYEPMNSKDADISWIPLVKAAARKANLPVVLVDLSANPKSKGTIFRKDNVILTNDGDTEAGRNFTHGSNETNLAVLFGDETARQVLDEPLIKFDPYEGR